VWVADLRPTPPVSFISSKVLFVLYRSFHQLKKKKQNEFDQENQNKDSVMKIVDQEQLTPIAIHYVFFYYLVEKTT
jgi:hypothetical protein